MKNCQLILNSNGLCVICLSEVEVKLSKADLFPLHHLTSKIDSNLGDVFKDVTVPWAPNAVLDRLEVLADVCEGCVHLCEELLYKFQDDVGRENCIKLFLDKMEGVELEDKYKTCGSPAAVFYAGIVDRLRKEIIEKLHLKPELGGGLNESATASPAGQSRIPNLLCIPDLPISQICTYLSFEDIKNFTTVSKDVRRPVFPSLINSSFIRLKNHSQIPTMIDFINATSNNFKNNVSLLISSESPEESSNDTRSTLLQLFQECGSQINHLKLFYETVWWENENGSDLSVLGMGNELFPNMIKLEMNYSMLNINDEKEDSKEKCAEVGTKAFLALLRNSPNLRELNIANCHGYDAMAPSLLKVIGESGLPIVTLELEGFQLTGSEMANLEPLKLNKFIVTDVGFAVEDLANWTKFLESQSATLKHLRLYVWDALSRLTFPRMESLETFKLVTFERECYGEQGSISYQTQLPKLEMLEVEEVYEGALAILFPTVSEPTTSVKELRLFVATLDEHIFDEVTRLFKLSKLEIPAASYLNDFWKDLSGLEELTLYPQLNERDSRGCKVSCKKITWVDEIITGLPLTDSDCGWVTDIRRHEEKYEKMETKKSLALLKRLKLLRICVRDGDNSFSPMILISDICWKVVLMKMESLKCIDFCGAHPSAVGASRKVLDEMGKKMDIYFGKKYKRNWIE